MMNGKMKNGKMKIKRFLTGWLYSFIIMIGMLLLIAFAIISIFIPTGIALNAYNSCEYGKTVGYGIIALLGTVTVVAIATYPVTNNYKNKGE